MPQYHHIYELPKALDLRGGKWLLNTVEANMSIPEREALTKQLLNGFKDIGIDSLLMVDNIIFNYITPDRFTFNLSAETLELLDRTTDYDYIICPKATMLKDEISPIMFSPPTREGTNSATFQIVVYDINRRQKSYSQKIVSTVKIDETDDDVRLTRSARGLINGSIKRGLKEIKKYSAK
jgi:hypothetical protein